MRSPTPMHELAFTDEAHDPVTKKALMEVVMMSLKHLQSMQEDLRVATEVQRML